MKALEHGLEAYFWRYAAEGIVELDGSELVSLRAYDRLIGLGNSANAGSRS